MELNAGPAPGCAAEALVPASEQSNRLQYITTFCVHAVRTSFETAAAAAKTLPNNNPFVGDATDALPPLLQCLRR